MTRAISTGLLALVLFIVPAFAWQGADGNTKRLYVEPFATKGGTEKLREDVIAELRKLSSVTVVSDAASADYILGGGGEIWIKGYRSFSPRSHEKLPANGVPIYSGYLSVELKNKQDVTLWSYLASPGIGSGDVSKDISKQIAKNLAEALQHGEFPATETAQSPSGIKLSAAGATFPYPVYQKWFKNFLTATGTQTSYDPVGSEAGIRKLLEGAIDFAASDSPNAVREIAPGEDGKYLLFPSVAGGIVPIVNLPGIAEEIAFTPEALAGIYEGKIKKWNDPILKKANRGVSLPDLDIVVIHRSDGSGTSFAWTSYLSATSPEWKAQVGASLDPKWPVGRGAAGNDGVAQLVKELGGSIGYVEYIYALENHLSYGKVRNQNGDFVEASLESIAAAVSRSMDLGDDFRASIVDAPGQGSYPIATFTWLVVPAHIADGAKRSAITSFLRWMLGPGQRQAAALGYSALPREAVVREIAALTQIH